MSINVGDTVRYNTTLLDQLHPGGKVGTVMRVFIVDGFPRADVNFGNGDFEPGLSMAHLEKIRDRG